MASLPDLAISHFSTAAYRLAETSRLPSAGRATAVMQRLSDKNPDDLEYKRNLAVYDTERPGPIEIGSPMPCRFSNA